MEEVKKYGTYQEYKQTLDRELTKTAEGFVRIGYLLKIARDTDILAESGYTSVTKFAEAEYGLDKTKVSHFIRINDRFSENGYSESLTESFRGFGYAKLAIMLQLPDELNEELTANYSKAEIQQIKEEVDKEKEVTDLERMMEEPGENETGLEGMDERTATLCRVLIQLGENDPGLYAKVYEDSTVDGMKEAMVPAGDAVLIVRVRGIGRLMLAITDGQDEVKLINTRSGEKEAYTWEEVRSGWACAFVGTGSAAESWERRYGRTFPVSPVKPDGTKEPKKTEPEDGQICLETAERQNAERNEEKADQKAKKVILPEWQSAYEAGQKVRILSNNSIGLLMKKAEDAGKWEVKFSYYFATMHESQFAPADEPEEKQAEEKQAAAGQTESQIEGQTTVEDFISAIGEKTEQNGEKAEKNSEKRNETGENRNETDEDRTDGDQDGRTIRKTEEDIRSFQKTMLELTERTRDCIIRREWQQAAAFVETLLEDLKYV